MLLEMLVSNAFEVPKDRGVIAFAKHCLHDWPDVL